MDFQSFLNRYNGQRNVGNTLENTGECVGLVMVWVKSLGLPHIWGHAKDLLTNADKSHYTVIMNSSTNVPQRGDIVVWGKSFNGTFGHTAIATGSGDAKSFEVFEQNNPIGSNSRLHRHTYSHVLGWLRPKVRDTSDTDYYKGLDLTNKDSMRVAVDAWERVTSGQLVEKTRLEVALAEIERLKQAPPISKKAELELIRDTAIKALS
jgi:hypothetical protein